MVDQTLTYIVIALSIALIVLFSTSFVILQSVRRMTRGRGTYWKHEASLTEGMEQKKRRDIKSVGPKTFYYLDRHQVEDLYSQIPHELEPKEVETRETKETKKGVTADLPVVTPYYGQGRAQEIKKRFEPERMASTMYNTAEEYLIDNGKVTFGLEEFEYDRMEIQKFEGMCGTMKAITHFEIPAAQRNMFISSKMREFATQDIQRLSKATNYVMLQTDFVVTSISPDGCMLSYVHPLSRYLSEQDDMFGVQQAKIELNCSKDHLTPSGHAAFAAGKTVRITTLGKVAGWEAHQQILRITPIAVY